jgi:hypothetical protein
MNDKKKNNEIKKDTDMPWRFNGVSDSILSSVPITKYQTYLYEYNEIHWGNTWIERMSE